MQRRSFLQSVIAGVALSRNKAKSKAMPDVLSSRELRHAKEELNVDIEQLKIELDESGLVIIPELIPRSAAARAAEILRDLMRKESQANGPDLHLRGVFSYLEPAHDEIFLPLVTHPICLELARHALGEGFQMTEIGRDGGNQALLERMSTLACHSIGWRIPGCRFRITFVF